MGIGIGDIIRIGGFIFDYGAEKKHDETQKRWNQYARAVDMNTLAGNLDRMARTRGLLTDRSGLLYRQAAELGAQASFANREGSRLQLETTRSRNRDLRDANRADRQAARDKAAVYAQLGVDWTELGRSTAQLQGEEREIAVTRHALREEFGARGAELDQMVTQTLTERGVIDRGFAEDMRLLDQRRRRRDKEIVELGVNQGARLDLLEASMASIPIERAQLADDALRAEGRVVAGVSARGMSGSYTQTQSEAIARQAGRQGRLLDARRAQGVAQAELIRSQGRTARGALALEGGRIAADRRATIGRAQVAHAGLDTRGTSLWRQRVELRGAQARQTAALDTRTGVAGQQRRVLAGRGEQLRDTSRRAEGRYADTIGAIQDQRGASLDRQREGYARAEESRLRGRALSVDQAEALQQQGRIASELKDLTISESIANWQIAELKKLPVGGAGPSVPKLFLNIAGALLD